MGKLVCEGATGWDEKDQEEMYSRQRGENVPGLEERQNTVGCVWGQQRRGRRR